MAIPDVAAGDRDLAGLVDGAALLRGRGQRQRYAIAETATTPAGADTTLPCAGSGRGAASARATTAIATTSLTMPWRDSRELTSEVTREPGRAARR
jgi:hypothetical protein